MIDPGSCLKALPNIYSESFLVAIAVAIAVFCWREFVHSKLRMKEQARQQAEIDSLIAAKDKAVEGIRKAYEEELQRIRDSKVWVRVEVEEKTDSAAAPPAGDRH